MIQFSNDNGPVFEQAWSYAQKQVRKLTEKYPDFYPMYTQEGAWKHQGPAWTDWSDGFLPGMMWMFGRRSETGSDEQKFWTDQAIKYTKPLARRRLDPDLHDLGFLFLPTFYRWYTQTRDSGVRDVLVDAGRNLSSRFQEPGGYLRSFVGDNSLFIDGMMNVGVIFFAARESNDRKLRDIGMRHTLTTRRTLVRGDGSTAHEGIFDTDTGEFLRHSTQQGVRSDSCWSRGLAWGMYGFTRAHEYLRDPNILNTAQACADYYITHTPADGVPPWDFNAPAANRVLVDTSAAAIAAAGFFRLSRQVSVPLKGHLYWSVGVRILRTLCERYVTRTEPKWEGILRGGVYHVHKGLGVDESVIWGDHFFVEALDQVLGN